MNKVFAILGGVALAAGILVTSLSSAEDLEVINGVVKDLSLEEVTIKESSIADSHPPELTPEMVSNIVILLKNVEANNGFSGIAISQKVSVNQVKAIYYAMKQKAVELSPKEVIEIP